jgi:ABC-type transporter Mla subunit MlaD
MTQQTEPVYSDILRSAWKRFAELDQNALSGSRKYKSIRSWIATLGVVATLLAIVTNDYAEAIGNATHPIAQDILRVTLIIVPIVISILAAYANRFISAAEWLSMRGSAEEILKEIYLYRTILRNHPKRDEWLSHRLTTIQRRLYKSMGGRMVLQPYKGDLPPRFIHDDPCSDPGYMDLTGDQYLNLRLLDQRDWHRGRLVKIESERKRIQLFILIMGGAGALLAALGGAFVTWVALTAAIASAFTGWEELRGLDKTVVIYSRTNLELTIVRDRWEAKLPEQRTEADFIRMVRSAEGVLWSNSRQYVTAMQEAMASAEGDDAELIEEMLHASDKLVDNLESKMMAEAQDVILHTSDVLGETIDEAGDSVRSMVDKAAGGITAITDQAETMVAQEVSETVEMAGDAMKLVSDETEEVRATARDVLDAVVDESEAYRETITDTTEDFTSQAAAMRETFETGTDAVLDETEALDETAAEVLETAAGEIADTQQNLETSLKSLVRESEALRRAVENGVEQISKQNGEQGTEDLPPLPEELKKLQETYDAEINAMLAQISAIDTENKQAEAPPAEEQEEKTSDVPGTTHLAEWLVELDEEDK